MRTAQIAVTYADLVSVLRPNDLVVQLEVALDLRVHSMPTLLRLLRVYLVLDQVRKNVAENTSRRIITEAHASTDLQLCLAFLALASWQMESDNLIFILHSLL